MTPGEDKRHQTADNDLAQEVAAVITEVTGKTIPAHDTDLSGLGFDSIAMLDVLATLEERFHISLNENIIAEFSTINRITRILKEMLRSRER
jgi:acyl carrier protein